MKASTPKFNINWLSSYLLEKDVPEEVILAATNEPAGINLADLQTLPLINYLKLLNDVAELLGDDNLGLNLAKNYNDEDFGYVGLTIQNCASLRDVLCSLHQFHAVLSQGIDMVFEEFPDTSTFTYRILLPTSQDTRHDIEHTAACFVKKFRSVLGQGWQPIRIDFVHSQPQDISRHIEEFGEAVCFFKQPSNKISFDTGCLDARLNDVNPILQKYFREKTQKLLEDAHKEESLLARVRYYTAMFHNSPRFGVDLIAELLFMSRRSLNRHLKGLGTSFRQIKEDVTQELAKTALLKSHVNIINIALELGYSDATSFGRSFKKSTGLTPTEYREQALKQE